MIQRILNRTKRASRKALAARYRNTAEDYSDMASISASSCPAPKPVKWVEYCRIMQLVYMSHAEDVEKLI